jgi:hypothetical protein
MRVGCLRRIGAAVNTGGRCPGIGGNVMSKIARTRSWLAVLTVAMFQTTAALAAEERAPLSVEIVTDAALPAVKITSLQKGLSIAKIDVNQMTGECALYRLTSFFRTNDDWRNNIVAIKYPINLEFGHFITVAALDAKVPFYKDPPFGISFTECKIGILQLDVETNYDDWTFRLK